MWSRVATSQTVVPQPGKESTRSGANTSRSCRTTSGWPACPAPVATCESDRDGSRTSKQDAMAAVASRLARHATSRELSGRHPANGVRKLAIKARESCGVSESTTAEGASKLLHPSLWRLRASEELARHTALSPGSPTLTIASAQKGSGSWPVKRIIPGNTSAAPGTPTEIARRI